MERGDGGVIQRSEEPRLVGQAGAPLRASGELIRKDLQRDVASETSVASAPDFPHATGAERTENLVRTQALSGAEAHGQEE